MTKPSQASKQLPQVRIIRGNRPDGYPKLFDERVDSPIRSSVDSWLSSAPSIEPSKPKPIKKKVDKQQSIAEDDETENGPERKWIMLAIVIFSILIYQNKKRLVYFLERFSSLMISLHLALMFYFLLTECPWFIFLILHFILHILLEYNLTIPKPKITYASFASGRSLYNHIHIDRITTESRLQYNDIINLITLL
ncbi:unnamed protein product [Rotaria magnacalcarata]